MGTITPIYRDDADNDGDTDIDHNECADDGDVANDATTDNDPMCRVAISNFLIDFDCTGSVYLHHKIPASVPCQKSNREMHYRVPRCRFPKLYAGLVVRHADGQRWFGADIVFGRLPSRVFSTTRTYHDVVREPVARGGTPVAKFAGCET